MSLAWFKLLAGIGLFIFAMSLTETSLKALAGRRFKKILRDSINTPLRSIGAGALVTGVLQSSSVVSLMTLSFVGAGLMSMRNAFAVTLGANLGTTFDSWIIATIGFKLEIIRFAYGLVIASTLLLIAFKKLKPMNDLSKFIIGFALLFIGLDWMKESASIIVGEIDMTMLVNRSPYWFILFGLVLTILIQSSSATTAITLTALYNDAISFNGAIGILIGSEVGTTIKIFIGAIGGIPDKKRVALGNLFFNISLLVVASIFMNPISHFIYQLIGEKEPLIGLVTFQTGINLTMIILFLPIMNKIGDFLEKQYVNDTASGITRHIQAMEPIFSDESLIATRKEIDGFLDRTILLDSQVIGIENNENASWYKRLMDKSSTEEKYNELKLLQGEILQYLVEMRSLNLKKKEIDEIGKLISVTRSIMHAAKKIKDVRNNFEELETSANDTLFENLTELRESQREFLSRVNAHKSGHSDLNTKNDLESLREFNDLRYNFAINETLNELDAGQIREFDSSTLLNIHRALHAANKSLIDVLEDLEIVNIQTKQDHAH